MSAQLDSPAAASSYTAFLCMYTIGSEQSVMVLVLLIATLLQTWRRTDVLLVSQSTNHHALSTFIIDSRWANLSLCASLSRRMFLSLSTHIGLVD